jgi:hypothetical protein
MLFWKAKADTTYRFLLTYKEKKDTLILILMDQMVTDTMDI